MMQRRLHLILCLFSLCAAFFTAIPAAVAEAEPPAKPLVTIRFNQSDVVYDQQLYDAIAKALALKPGVRFDVVSRAPYSGTNADEDAKWQTTAGRNTRSVIATMADIGVPMSRVTVTGKFAPELAVDETQVFAY